MPIRVDDIELQKSHPTMGAWIEIRWGALKSTQSFVAPHDGCVDWNQKEYMQASKKVN